MTHHIKMTFTFVIACLVVAYNSVALYFNAFVNGYNTRNSNRRTEFNRA